MLSAEEILELYNMKPHPEGGFSKLLFEDTEILKEGCLPVGYDGSRPLWNAIYYLLPTGSKSIFHKIRMNEMWNFHLGGSLDLYTLSPQGKLSKIVMGNRLDLDEHVSYVIPKNHWIAAEPTEGSPYSLVSCVTCPGFTFLDWQKGKREHLIKLYPNLENLIIEFT